MRHQIILIGRRMQNSLIGVKRFRPDSVSLLYTVATKDVYKPFAQMLRARNVRVDEFLIDPYDIKGVKNVCRKICMEYNDDDTVQMNVTEGTKVSAMSLMMVAEDFGFSTVYFTQEGECIDFIERKRMDVTECISNEEFFELFGNNLSSYELCSEMSPLDLSTSWAVKRFIESRPKSFQRIKKQFRSCYGSHIDRLPEQMQVDHEHNMVLDMEGGALKITDKGKTVFDEKNPNAVFLFFTGRWWEIIVSDVVYRWDLARRKERNQGQVWRSVEFRGVGAKTKNELDILVNDDRRLILIECKSGYISQDNIYKIDSVKQTYGGEHSKGILVSYYPLDPDLALKCRDLHIYYFAPEKETECTAFIQKLPQWLDTVASEIE